MRGWFQTGWPWRGRGDGNEGGNKNDRSKSDSNSDARRSGAGDTATAGEQRQRCGREGEDRALAHLQAQGLRLLQRNFSTPGRGGGEIDLIMQAPDATVVFVEVRVRRSRAFGGAGASIDAAKRRRIVQAARHFLLRWPGAQPACRFDVVLIEQGAQGPLQWLKAAFDEE